MELMKRKYVDITEINDACKSYIKWIIDNSGFYILNADPRFTHPGGCQFFGLNYIDWNTSKIYSFWADSDFIKNKVVLSIKDFIEELEITSGIPQYALIKTREEIGINKFKDLYPVGDYYERENETTSSNSVDQNSNDLDQNSNVTDPNEGCVQQYSNKGIEESGPEIKSAITDFDIPKGYQLESYQLFNCQNSDPMYNGNNKVFIKFKLKKL